MQKLGKDKSVQRNSEQRKNVQKKMVQKSLQRIQTQKKKNIKYLGYISTPLLKPTKQVSNKPS